MKEQLEAYVNRLFADAALTIRNAEVRQEILQHALDRYDDLIASGKTEQEAYDETVSGIGDVSGLYEHKKAAQDRPAADPPSGKAQKKRDFPAPPAASEVFSSSDAPKQKKRLPGWAIALICAGAVLLVLLTLSFAAGHAVWNQLSAGSYTYDHAGDYEIAERDGFGETQAALSSSSFADVTEVEIHWLSGSVYLAESDEDGILLQEDYTGDNDDYRMRYTVNGSRLIIQPCRSKLFGSMDLPEKTLTVFLPEMLKEISVETVSADVELMGGAAGTLSISTTSGNILGPGLQVKELELGTVSGDIRLSQYPAGCRTVDCETVSGEVSLGFTSCPEEIDLNSVSGDLALSLPEGSRYDLEFDTVSGSRYTSDQGSGGADLCEITAETVSGDLTIRADGK